MRARLTTHIRNSVPVRDRAHVRLVRRFGFAAVVAAGLGADGARSSSASPCSAASGKARRAATPSAARGRTAARAEVIAAHGRHAYLLRRHPGPRHRPSAREHRADAEGRRHHPPHSLRQRRRACALARCWWRCRASSRRPISPKRAPPTKRRSKTWRRYQELFDRGFASQARLDAVRPPPTPPTRGWRQAASRIADRTIRAPFAGVVGLRTASPGQFVRPGDQIGTLDDISEIKLDFDVPETQIWRALRPASPSLRAHGGVPGARVHRRIANVDSRVDPTTRTVRVRAMSAQPRRALASRHADDGGGALQPAPSVGGAGRLPSDEGDAAFVFRVAGARRRPSAERVRSRSRAAHRRHGRNASGPERWRPRRHRRRAERCGPGQPVRRWRRAPRKRGDCWPHGDAPPRLGKHAVTLSDLSVRRPVLATVLSLIIIAFGAIAFTRCRCANCPTSIGRSSRSASSYPGASAQVVETQITRVIEDQLSGIDGRRLINATSRDGRASVNVEFSSRAISKTPPTTCATP